MDKIVMETCNLRQRSKYCDLEIKCDGITFYVHRLIVCEKSEVLARECDGGVEGRLAMPVNHAVFDARTLERMLHFMYQGDYTVPTSNEALVQENGGLNGHSQAGSASKTVAPHLRKKASGAGLFSLRGATPLYGPATAHVYVYAIARHYQMADLKALALTKFKNTIAVTSVHEFLGVAKVVYLNTADSDDELRHELLLKLMNEHIDWLTDGGFTKALSSDAELHAFSVVVASATSERLLEKIALLKTEVETQHAANVQLHCGLDQANKDRAEANRQIRKLQQDLGKTNEENSRLEERLRISETWGRDNYEKAFDNHKAAQERDELLEKERARADRASLLLVQKDEEIEERKEDIRQKDELTKQKDLKIKEETDRASRYAEIIRQKNEEIKGKDKDFTEEKARANEAMERATKLQEISRQIDEKLQKESKRADRNYELCTQRDQTIKVKDELCKQATENFRVVEILINCIDECRHCAEPFVTLLQQDNKSGLYMLRCNECQTRHFSFHA